MRNKLFKFCFVIFCFLQINIFAAELKSINCDPVLQPIVTKILQLPEARDLIARVQEEGSLRIIANRHTLSQQFGAYWDMELRMVCVNLSFHETEGQLIGSILFELHNAIMNSQLNALDDLAAAGGISKDNYVEGVEFIEYQNSKRCAEMAQRGIDLGIFPKDARLPTYNSFEEHFRIQKIGGHSQWIERTYYELTQT